MKWGWATMMTAVGVLDRFRHCALRLSPSRALSASMVLSGHAWYAVFKASNEITRRRG